MAINSMFCCAALGQYIPISYSNMHFPCGSCVLAKAHNLPMFRKQQRKWIQLSRLSSNVLSKVVCNFWVYSTTFGEFQAFITDFRSMSQHGNSIKLNLLLYSTKVALLYCGAKVTCPESLDTQCQCCKLANFHGLNFHYRFSNCEIQEIYIP